MLKRLIPLVVLLTIGVVLFWKYGFNKNHLSLQGVIEGTVYSQVAEVAGKITEVNVQLGKVVEHGEVIFRLDKTDLLFAKEQLQIAYQMKQENLKNFQSGTRLEEMKKARNDIDIAEANYRSLEATLAQTREDVLHIKALHETGAVAQTELDKAILQETALNESLVSAVSQVERTKSQLSQLQRQTSLEISLTELDLQDMESKIRQLEDKINKHEIFANTKGTVIAINYNLGSMANVGYILADISADNEKYAVFYVPENKLNLLSYGQQVAVRSKGQEYQGEISFIDVKAQYTPRDLQTSAMRNKVSVKVKALLPDEPNLIAGNKVEVRIYRISRTEN
jgi:HlyD family secretion protein